MEAALLNRLCSALEFGFDILQCPQDLSAIPNKETIIVADDFNGILVFTLNGQLKQHIKACSDAKSISYCSYSKHVVVSVCKAMSNGDSTPGELHFYAQNTSTLEFELISKMQIPVEPKIAPTYIRWVTVHPVTGSIYIASGDNTVAALWKYDRIKSDWKTVLTRSGDLEHPCILAPFKNDKTEILLNSWDSEQQWSVKLLSFDKDDALVGEKLILPGNQPKITEPWCSIAEPTPGGRIYVYDYQVGNIWMLKADTPAQREIAGAVKAGQWTSMEIADKWLLVACSDENCVRGFRLPT